MEHDIVGRGWAFPIQLNSGGGVDLVEGVDEINQAIRIILGTAVGERVMRPEFGSRLHELVFAPINEETKSLAHRYVEDALTMWEPRITLRSVRVLDPFRLNPLFDVGTAPGCLAIDIQYEIKTTGDIRSLVYPFYQISGE